LKAIWVLRIAGPILPIGRGANEEGWKLERDAIRLNRHRALVSCLRMISSENRFALFRIML